MVHQPPDPPPGVPPAEPVPGSGMPDRLPADTPGAPPPGTPPPGVPVEAPTLPGAGPPPSRGRAIAIAIAVLLLVGGAIAGVLVARSGGEGSKGPALKSGWTRHVLENEGFSVGLPPGWMAVPTSSADEALKALKDANPELERLVRDQVGSSLSSLLKLLAFDVNSPTLAKDFATNMNVLVAPLPASVGFDEFVGQNLAQLQAVPGVTGIQSQRLTLPAGPSALVHSRLSVSGGGESQIVSISQYLIRGEGSGYILSFSTRPDALSGYASLFEEIARTFRLV